MSYDFLVLPPQTETTRAWAARLADGTPEARVVVAESVEEARRRLPDAEAAFGTLPPELLPEARTLRWLQAPAAAPPAGYYYPELVRHPVTITNFRGIFNDHIGAHIMAYVLAFARGLQHYIPQQLRREWAPLARGEGIVHLPDATALIVGVGGIGAEAARLCAAFGMRVVGVDARREVTPPGLAALHRPDALDRLLPESDFVILTVPHTPETEGFFDARRIGLMRRGAVLINIGRGATVRLGAVDAALRSGHLGGAGLDVFEEEPLPPDDPLWTAPNALLTPHVAGEGPHLDERRFAIIRENAQRFGRGAPLVNVVDKERWY